MLRGYCAAAVTTALLTSVKLPTPEPGGKFDVGPRLTRVPVPRAPGYAAAPLSPSLILNRARERRWLISGISAFHSEELNVRSDLKGVAWASEKQPLKHANSVPLFRRILG